MLFHEIYMYGIRDENNSLNFVRPQNIHVVNFFFSGEAIVLDITAEFCRQLGEEEEGGS